MFSLFMQLPTIRNPLLILKLEIQVRALSDIYRDAC